MTTIKNLSKIILLILLMSCNTKKSITKPKQNSCYIIETNQNNFSKNLSLSVLRNIEAFKKNKYNLQLLHIKSVQGYDYKESSKLFYLKENTFYSMDFEKENQIEYLKTDSIKLKLKKINKKHYLGYCENSGTKIIINEFYLKENDSITFSFILTGKDLDYFFRNNISNELLFLQEFIE